MSEEARSCKNLTDYAKHSQMPPIDDAPVNEVDSIGFIAAANRRDEAQALRSACNYCAAGHSSGLVEGVLP